MKKLIALMFSLSLLVGCSGSDPENVFADRSTKSQKTRKVARKSIEKADKDKDDDDDDDKKRDKDKDKDVEEISLPKPEGNLRYTIMVRSFENKSNWHGKWHLGNGFTEILTDVLQQSGWFIVIGDKQMRAEAMTEQDFALTGRTAVGKKTPKVGRLTPAQLLVKGVITHAQHDTTGGGGGLSFKGIRLGGSGGKAEINMTIYIVNSETGQVMASKSIVGKSGRKGVSLGYHGSGLGGLRGGGKGYKKDNMGKACENAVGQAVLFLIDQLEDIPWEGSVALVKFDGTILINRGTREGVQVGNKFDVGSVQEIVDDDTGEVLDREMTKVGILEVTRVKDKVSYCKAIEGGENIEKGMTIYPAR